MSKLNVKIGFNILITYALLFNLNIGYSNGTVPMGIACDSISIPIPFGSTTYSFAYNDLAGSELGEDIFISSIAFKIEHDYVTDLTLRLISPSGASVLLFEQVGGNGDDFGDIQNPDPCSNATHLVSVQNDEYCSALSIEDGVAPFIGSFKPEGALEDFYDSSSPNGDWVLEIDDNNPSDDGTLVYFDIMFAAESCNRPVVQSISTVNSTAVELDIEDNEDDCSALIVEWGGPGFIPGADDQIGGGVNLLQFDCSDDLIINGLVGQAQYEVYVRRKCSDNQWSLNSCVEVFSTACTASPITFLTDFNIQDGFSYTPACSENYTLPGAWMNYDSGDRMDWGILAGTSNIGTNSTTGAGNCLYLHDNCFGKDSVLLYSPCIDIVAADPTACHMSFDALIKSPNAFDFFKLQISLNGGFIYTDLWTADLDEGTEVWEKIYIDLSNFDGANAQFRFFAKRGNKSSGRAYLDNIAFNGSLNAGGALFTYFIDDDLDGFGTERLGMPSCSNQALAGFSSNADDCDDTDSNINPAAEELACNGLDDDCNSATSDLDLPVPLVPGVFTICSMEEISIALSTINDYDVLWYNTETGGQAFHDEVSYDYIKSNIASSDTLIDYLFVEYSAGDCRSSERAMIQFNILPGPDLTIDTSTLDDVCFGDSINLQNLSIQDNQGLSQSLTFYSDVDLNIELEAPFQVPVAGTEEIWVEGLATNNCRDVLAITLESKDYLGLEINGDSVVCTGSDFTIGYEIIPEYNIESLLWSNGLNTPELSDQFSGFSDSLLYWIRVEDEFACIDTDSIWIIRNNFIDSLQLSMTDVTECFETDDGSLQVTPFGPLQSYKFTLSEVGGQKLIQEGLTATFTDLASGLYTLSIENPQDPFCVFDYPETIIINGGGATVDLVLVDSVKCQGASDGSIELQINGVNPSINWSNGIMDQAILSNLNAGDYSVTISDENCDLVLDSIQVNEPDPLQINVLEMVDTVSCFGASDGFIEVFTVGGTQPLNYLWSNLEEESKVENIEEGNYSLTVIDGNNCVEEASFFINSPDKISITSDLTNPSCSDFDDGSIGILASGGSGQFQYFWDGVLGQANRSDLATGNYGLVVEDDKNCMLDTIVVLEPFSPLDAQIINLEPATCLGLENGEAQLEVSGGQGAYSILWEDGNSSLIRSDLELGAYKVTISDSSNCSVEVQVEVGIEEEISVDWTLHPASCLSKSDGKIEINTASGQSPNSYSIFQNGAALDFDALPGGELLLVYMDGRACVDSTWITHEAMDAFDTNIVLEDPNCENAPTGQISLGIDGNFVPYTFAWEDSNSTEKDRPELQAGTYTVTITDGQGCSESEEIVLEAQSDIQILPVFVDSISCTGKQDGAVFVEVIGGVEPYSFTWNNGEHSKNLENLSPDIYQLTVVDSLNCAVESDSFNLTAVQQMQVSLNYIEDSSFPCTNKPLDSLKLSISGGRAPYSAMWSDGSTDLFFFNPSPDIYEVNVTDNYGCSESLDNIIVKSNPELIELQHEFLNNSTYSCDEGLLIDTVMFTLIEGQVPLNYSISNAQGVLIDSGITYDSVFTFSHPISDTYELELNDLNGCTFKVEDLVLEKIDILSLELDEIQSQSCAYIEDASIEFSQSGGNAPFAYTLVFDGEEQVFSNTLIEDLSFGDYEIIVSDGFNCSDTLVASIQETVAVEAEVILSGVNNCFGDNNVAVDTIIFSQGDQFDYELDWSSEIIGLAAGSDTLYILTEEGCVYEEYFEVDNLSDSPVQINESLSYKEDPSCLSPPDGSINLTVTGGNSPYNFMWEIINEEDSYEQITDTSLNLDQLTDGLYSITITDANNCPVQQSPFLAIELNDEDVFRVESDYEQLCFNESNTLIEFQLEGGLMPYSIEWDGGVLENIYASISIVDGIIPEQYDFTITDVNDCEIINTIDLMLGDSIILSEYELNAGTLILVFEDPTSSLSYSWGVNEFIVEEFDVGIQFTEPDTFQLLVIDELDCSETFVFDINALINKVEAAALDHSINVFPNPSSEKLNIELDAVPNQTLDLLLFDNMGKLVVREEINTQLFTYDIPGYLKSGVYSLIILEDERPWAYKRFIISK